MRLCQLRRLAMTTSLSIPLILQLPCKRQNLSTPKGCASCSINNSWPRMVGDKKTSLAGPNKTFFSSFHNKFKLNLFLVVVVNYKIWNGAVLMRHFCALVGRCCYANKTHLPGDIFTLFLSVLWLFFSNLLVNVTCFADKDKTVCVFLTIVHSSLLFLLHNSA